MLEQALKEIKRGVSEIIDEERVIALIKNFLEKGETFLVKAGFDPTAPDLHLGHTVLLQKMAMLQKYGAIVQFLIGDFTGMWPTHPKQGHYHLGWGTDCLKATASHPTLTYHVRKVRP